MDIYKESEEWTSIKSLRQKGFLVVHVTNAFDGGAAQISGQYIDYSPLYSIERDITSGDKYTISCSSLHPQYPCSVVISRQRGEGFSIGDVLSAGKIYAAYFQDGGTSAKSAQFRDTIIRKYPVQIAVTSTSVYNELLPQNWRMDGIFYTLQTPENIISALKQLCIKYKLSLYKINEIERTWEVFLPSSL